MKLGFEVVCIDEGPEGVLYAVRYEDRTDDEWERFVNNDRFPDRDYHTIEVKIDEMLDVYGFRENLFWNYEKYGRLVKAVGSRKVRLYVYRHSNLAIVVGGSVVKRKRKISDEELVLAEFERVEYVARRIEHRISKTRYLRIGVNGRFDGDLHFEQEDIYGYKEN